ncbi:ATP-binding cassette, subfamily B [Tindallia californiensis]|uniref:ATP-binding cassette, subfamily B n=1 Tax=Tindallia californiensis TaxID=159292 RepID=A0A1H3IFP0_9FIRM|nr:ATP-binding cassette, subfamily B [Tindallia californiensis]
MSSYLTLIPFIKKYKWFYLWGVLSLIMVDALQLAIPEILRRITDALQFGTLEKQQLFMYSLTILFIGLLMMLFRFLWRILIINSSRRMEYELRNEMFEQFLRLSTSYYNDKKTGDLIAHATNDILAVRNAASGGIITFTDALFLNLAAVTMMILTTNLKLTLIALIPMPILAFAIYQFGASINQRFKIVQEAFSELTESVQESFSGIRVIKSFSREEQEIHLFDQSNENLFNKNMNLAILFGTFSPTIQFISSISFFITLIYGTQLVMNHTITLGSFVAFNGYLASMVWSVPVIGFVINILQRGAASMSRINKLMEETPNIVEASDAIDLRNVHGHIEFSNVTFYYTTDKVPILKNFTFHIDPGSTIGIMGPTGSGKSTIPTLLLRLYDPDDGEIKIDGIPIKDTSLRSLRDQIGYVEQNSFIFSASIYENIAFGKEDHSKENIEMAAKLAGLHQDIVSFPETYNTLIGERGVTLSGGQKQRLAIARALVKNPPILILDDSLSAVDTQTEERILEGIKSTIHAKTTVIIAHRISTLKYCDKILVLDNGRPSEYGSHEELIKLDGFYAYQYYQQMLEDEIT